MSQTLHFICHAIDHEANNMIDHINMPGGEYESEVLYSTQWAVYINIQT